MLPDPRLAWFLSYVSNIVDPTSCPLFELVFQYFKHLRVECHDEVNFLQLK